MSAISYCPIRRLPSKERSSYAEKFSAQEAEKVRDFHKSLPEYERTPLARLSGLAESLGIKDFFVKDESARFGLNAFKALGASYCVEKCVQERRAAGDDAKLTFVTATDGNHGRAIAWAAARQGHASVVYMPKGSSPERLENIKKEGAQAFITEFNYDDAVRFANAQAQKNDWIMVQDTAWEGYTEYPTWIMQGYMTMALEAVEQLEGIKPTHVFLQAGVGAMSGAVAGFLSSYFARSGRPRIAIVEPDAANCIYRTAKASDGALHAACGDLNTIMAGLACGEPCIIGWELLRDCADFAVSVPDEIAAAGMRMLGNPLPGDDRVISGESGAAGAGFAARLLKDGSLKDLKEALGLGEDSVVLCFSTEGDTDKENYRRIVWDGLYPSF